MSLAAGPIACLCLAGRGLHCRATGVCICGADALRRDVPITKRLPAAAFLPYLESQMVAVNDTTMQQEVDLLNKLIAL